MDKEFISKLFLLKHQIKMLLKNAPSEEDFDEDDESYNKAEMEMYADMKNLEESIKNYFNSQYVEATNNG